MGKGHGWDCTNRGWRLLCSVCVVPKGLVWTGRKAHTAEPWRDGVPYTIHCLYTKTGMQKECHVRPRYAKGWGLP